MKTEKNKHISQVLLTFVINQKLMDEDNIDNIKKSADDFYTKNYAHLTEKERLLLTKEAEEVSVFDMDQYPDEYDNKIPFLFRSFINFRHQFLRKIGSETKNLKYHDFGETKFDISKYQTFPKQPKDKYKTYYDV